MIPINFCRCGRVFPLGTDKCDSYKAEEELNESKNL